MTNHPRRQRDRLVEMTEQHIADLGTLTNLRRHVELGRYRNTQIAAVRTAVKAARETDQ